MGTGSTPWFPCSESGDSTHAARHMEPAKSCISGRSYGSTQGTTVYISTWTWTRRCPCVCQPLTRYSLISSGCHNTFVWTAHHAAYDGWFADSVLDMVRSEYAGISNKPLVPYGSFIKHLAASTRARATIYWKTQLEGYSRVDFPTSTFRNAIELTQIA